PGAFRASERLGPGPAAVPINGSPVHHSAFLLARQLAVFTVRAGRTSQDLANTNSRQSDDRNPIKSMSSRAFITRPSLPAGMPSRSSTNTTVSPTSMRFDLRSSLFAGYFFNGAATLESRKHAQARSTAGCG